MKQEKTVPSAVVETTNLLDSVIEQTKGPTPLDAVIAATENKAQSIEGEFVVTANYNRDGKGKWLVRKPKEHPDQAKAYDNLTIEGRIEMVPAGIIEHGRGCTRVALCRGTVSFSSSGTDGLTRLRFNHGLETPGGEDVLGMSKLVLGQHIHGKVTKSW